MKQQRVPRFPGLYQEEGSDGARYRIVITRKQRRFQEYFYFGKKRTKRDARREAIARWKEIRATAPVLTGAEFAQVERRKSPSGIVGVRRIADRTKGRDYEYWTATWTDSRGRKQSRKFSIKKYGAPRAKKLAREARAKGLARLMKG